MKQSILIVDDDLDILELLEIYLTNDGYDVIKARDGINALEKMNDSISLVLLDVMMPKMDGIKTCVEMRKKFNTPILFLTAKSQDADMIVGLSVGADDYIKKPFTPAILTAKVKAILRRYQVLGGAKELAHPALIIVKDLQIDTKAYQVLRDQQSISLTKTEFEILLLLVKNRGQVFSVQRIYESIWNEPYFEDSANTVMVHIKRLRNKIELTDNKQDIIQTVWGVGYKIE